MAKIIGKTEDGKDIYGTNFEIEVKDCKQLDNGKRVVGMVGSTPSVDRDGDTIDQSGWDTKAYKKNSVVLWGHDHSIPAIGRANKFSKTKEALTFDEIEFPEEGIHKFADMIYSLMKAGFIKMGSVSFLPTKMEQRKREEGEAEVGYYPTSFKKQELIEFSICNVGCNRDALATHLGEKGFKTSGKIKIGDQEFDVKQLIDGIFAEDDAAEEVEINHDLEIDPEVKEIDIDVEIKTVIPYKKYPLAAEDTVWNGPQEVRAAEVADLKLMSTWFDSENPDVKGSYKLPHHREADKYTVWKGVSAAMGALLGARGGVDVPEGDRKRIYSHLKKHYVEFKKDVPEFKVYEDAELKELFPELIEEKEIDVEEKETPTDCSPPHDHPGSGLKPGEQPIEIKTIEEFVTDIQKAGAVLSRTNKNKLKNAATAINEVLASSESAVEDGEPVVNEKQESPKELQGVIERLDKLTEIVNGLVEAKETPVVEVKEEDGDINLGDINVEKKSDEINLEDVKLPEKEVGTDIEIKDLDQDKLVEAFKIILGDVVPKAVSKEINRVTGKLS